MAECISLNCHLFEPEFEPVGGMMATHVKLKRDKVGAQDYDAQIKGKGTVFVTYFSAPLIQLCSGFIPSGCVLRASTTQTKRACSNKQ